jgi:predicted thioredoxin/glutaredoxin
VQIQIKVNFQMIIDLHAPCVSRLLLQRYLKKTILLSNVVICMACMVHDVNGCLKRQIPAVSRT